MKEHLMLAVHVLLDEDPKPDKAAKAIAAVAIMKHVEMIEALRGEFEGLVAELIQAKAAGTKATTIH